MNFYDAAMSYLILIQNYHSTTSDNLKLDQYNYVLTTLSII